jgi:hypothetical protein
MMMGSVSKLHPWTLLHALPIYGSLRVPSRFAVLFTFYLALCAGVTVQWLLGRLATWNVPVDLWAWRRAFPALLTLAVVLHLAWGNAEVIDRWRGAPLPPVDRSARYQITSMGEYGRYASFPARGVSTQGCYTGMTYPAASGLRVGPVPQARMAGEARAESRVTWLGRTANTMTIEVESKGGTLVVNQTWARGWSSSVGTVAAGDTGLVEVQDLPEGIQTVRLRYRPETLTAAIGVGSAGAVGTLLMWLVPTWRRRRRTIRPN